MISLAFNTYVHLIFIVTIFCCLTAEIIILKKNLSAKSLKILSQVDGIYGLAAIMVVGTGLLNWFIFGKGSSYYSSNLIFLIKVGLFIIVGLLSIYPTVMIARAKKSARILDLKDIEITNERKIKRFIFFELIIMGCIPLLAELMANGIDL
ncbi:DUF2214 family protein [Ekhidna sp.]|uniref:DUF2214 family protein n=1 Tax=Ekhidna sp. TaxID=2608089 RepID=UPI003B50C80D